MLLFIVVLNNNNNFIKNTLDTKLENIKVLYKYKVFFNKYLKETKQVTFNHFKTFL